MKFWAQAPLRPARLPTRQIRRYVYLLREAICRAANFKAENSFVSASHSLLTQADFRRSEDAARAQVAVRIATVVAACPGAALMSAASRLRRRGQAQLERLGLPASRGCCTAGTTGDGTGRFAVGGVAVQIRGGSVIFGSVTVGLSRLCRVGTFP